MERSQANGFDSPDLLIIFFKGEGSEKITSKKHFIHFDGIYHPDMAG